MRKIKFFSKYGLSQLLRIAITIVAYFYIYYRVSDTLQQTENFELFEGLNPTKYFLFIACLILMIFNWLLEAIKWKYLLYPVEKISVKLSVKSVFIGITCAIFTPYRLGEYYGRPIVLKKENRTQALMVNILGSISQNIVTIGLGIIGFLLLINTHQQAFFSKAGLIIIITSLLVFISLLITCYFFPILLLNFFKKTNKLIKYTERLEFLSYYRTSQLLLVLILSFSRYLIFFTQYYLLLSFFDIEISLTNAFISISLSYVFLFSIPGIPIADIGIRGSLALFFLGMFSNDSVAIIAASSSLWIINLAIPSIIGSYFLMLAKKSG